MASRMDSTGIPNRIQVMESTAEIIQNLGYICDYRDKIHVKGKDDLVGTYFVRLDENYNLVKNVTEIDDEWTKFIYFNIRFAFAVSINKEF